MTAVRRGGVLALLTLALLVVSASPAAAHASLQGTTPSAGETLAEPPSTLRLDFNEAVQPVLGGIRMFDARGDRLDVGAPRAAGAGGVAIVADAPDVGDGTYVVTWRVTSDDSHPIRGSFTFSVGSSTATPQEASNLATRLLTENGGDPVVGALMAIVRWAVFLGIAVLVGAVAFLAVVWPGGRTDRLARRIVWASWAAVLLGSLIGFLLEGPYLAGLGVFDALQPDLWSEVWGTRFGRVWVGRALLLMVAIPLLRALLPERGPAREHPLGRRWKIGACVAGLVLVATPALAGHPTSGRWVPVAITADVVHVGAVGLWLGGLVMLGVAFARRLGESELRVIAPRYSRYALASVVAIVASGAVQAIRQVDRLGALSDTDYGRLLAIKLLFFTALVVAAAVSRDVVNRRWLVPANTATLVSAGHQPGVPEGDPDDEPYPEGYVLDEPTAERRLRRGIAIELGIGIVILVVTALLVNAAPPREQARGPFTAVLVAQDLSIDTTLTPARRGANELHLTALTSAGAPRDVVEMSAELGQAEKDIAPIEIKLIRSGPGHYVSPDFTVPFAGEWELTIKTFVTDVDEVDANATVRIQ